MFNPPYTPTANATSSQQINTIGSGGLDTIFSNFESYINKITGFETKFRNNTDDRKTIQPKEVLNILDGSKAGFTLILPPTSEVSQQALTFSRFDTIGANTINIRANGTETIFDPFTGLSQNSIIIPTGAGFSLYPISGKWYIAPTCLRSGRANLNDLEFTLVKNNKNIGQQGGAIRFGIVESDVKQRWNTTSNTFTAGLNSILIVSGLFVNTEVYKEVVLTKNGVDFILDNYQFINYTSAGSYTGSVGDIMLVNAGDVISFRVVLNRSSMTLLEEAFVSFLTIPLN